MIKLNGVEIKPTVFPDKTSQIWKLAKHQLELAKKKHIFVVKRTVLNADDREEEGVHND